MNLLAIILIAAGQFALTAATLVAASANDIVQDVGVFYRFGEEVIIQAQFSNPAEIQEAYLFIKPIGENARFEKLEVGEDGNALLVYDAARFPLRPFAHTQYWFRIVTAAGEEIESQRYAFEYVDNRFEWTSLVNDQYQVNWYEGDRGFGQQVLNAAENGLQSAQTYLLLPPPEPVIIYVYASAADLRKTLQRGQESWVAGHTSPDLGVIVVSIPPGAEQNLELERQIPHELMHLLQYQLVGDDYQKIPPWLLEGMASLAETYPNPDYSRGLSKAVESQSLLPVSSLCRQMPREASQAFLAYAQSASFVKFLHQEYGSEGLKTLLLFYQTGLGCEEGVQAALGRSLTQLEGQWQSESLKVNPVEYALRQMAPYLLLLLVILIPPGLMIVFTKIHR